MHTKVIEKPIKMTSKGTFTLPAAVRKELGLTGAGDHLQLRFRQGSRTVELQAPVELKVIQAKLDAAIPQGLKPLGNVRQYLNDQKISKFKPKTGA